VTNRIMSGSFTPHLHLNGYIVFEKYLIVKVLCLNLKVLIKLK